MWHMKVQEQEQDQGWQKHFFLHEVTFFRPKTQSNKYTQQISLANSELASKGKKNKKKT